jgi:hypothetical protein
MAPYKLISRITLHRAPCYLRVLAPQLRPDLANAVDLELVVEDPTFLRLQRGHHTRHVPIAWPDQHAANMCVIIRGGDQHDFADRLDPMRLAVIVDERDHGLNRRSSSAWAN